MNDAEILHQGRNNPCLCGSEKKYKHCCLIRIIRTPSATLSPLAGQNIAEGLHAARGLPCLLCGASARTVALFVPTATFLKTLGVSGKKAIAYSLCRSCDKRPDLGQEVEDRILETPDLDEPPAS